MNNRFVGGHVSSAGGPSKAIGRALEIEANCLQIFAGSPRSWARTLYSQSEVDAYKTEKAKIAGPMFIHALYLINLASTDQNNLEKSATSLKLDLQNGDLLGCSGVVVHVGSHLGLGFDHIKDDLVALIKKVLEESSNTPLLLENSSGQKGKIGTLDELEYLLRAIPDKRLGACLDTAHLYEAGVDIKQQSVITDYVDDLSKRGILERVALLHLNDSRTALGSTKDEHENIGSGQIGELGIKNFINHEHLKHLPLILEVPGFNGTGPDIENIRIVRKLLTQ